MSSALNDSGQGALDFLLEATESTPSRPVRLLGIEPNVMVCVHTNACMECKQYAQHVKSEFLGAQKTSPIAIEEVEKALGKAFPTVAERLRSSPEEIANLQQRAETSSRKLHDEERAYKKLDSKYLDLLDDFNSAKNALAECEGDLATAKQHYYHLGACYEPCNPTPSSHRMRTHSRERRAFASTSEKARRSMTSVKGASLPLATEKARNLAFNLQ